MLTIREFKIKGNICVTTDVRFHVDHTIGLYYCFMVSAKNQYPEQDLHVYIL